MATRGPRGPYKRYEDGVPRRTAYRKRLKLRNEILLCDSESEKDKMDITIRSLKNENKALRARVQSLETKAVLNLEKMVNEVGLSLGRVGSPSSERITSLPLITSSPLIRPPTPSSFCQRDTKDNDNSFSPDVATLCPHVIIRKVQMKLLDTLHDAKKYTYTLVEMVWSRKDLSTHSLTGKSSNAHKEKEPKPMLDRVKVKSICGHVMKRFHLADDKAVKGYIRAKMSIVRRMCYRKKDEMDVGH